MKKIVTLTSLIIFTFSIFGQNTIKQNQLQSTVLNQISASGTQAKRFEIAQLSYNSHHWQNSSIVTIELFNVRYQSGYEKYTIELGYSQGAQGSSPKVTLVESRGINHSAKIELGTPQTHTTSRGGHPNLTIPVYADIRNYAIYVTKITHLKSRVSNFTDDQQIIITEAPSSINIPDFVVPKPSFNLTNGNIGIGTDTAEAKLHIKDYINTANYPSQTSRGDVSQLMTNVNNTLEFGLAGASNTRRSWILSRHSDLSGTYGKYYNTLHLQPDTGNKSQYRGIAIGYPANEHINVGTHLAVNGNVGIGTKNPTSPLYISNTNDAIATFKTLDNKWLYTNWVDKTGKRKAYVGLSSDLSNYIIGLENGANKFTIPKGNVGIGTFNPTYKFEWANGTNTGFLDFTLEGNAIGSKTGNLGLWTNGSEKLTVLKNGNIGVGTKNPKGFKLGVNGKVAATEVKVALYTNWPDFVFYDDYKLPALLEVENHIKEKGHLKDIPSAKEVEKNGIFLGEMNSKLLQKIEELTLYTIAQEKEITSLKNETKKIKFVQKENDQLKETMNSILKRLEDIESK